MLRVLEPSHAAMNSSLHSLAHDMEAPDLGAFLYSLRRLPASIWQARVIVVGQEAEAFSRAGVGRIEDWEAVEAPARRRRWYDSGTGTLAVLLASHERPRRRDPDARRLPARVEQAARAAARRGPARGPRAARRRRRDRRHRGGLDARARVLARRARRIRHGGPRPQAQPAAADARRVAVGLRAAHAPLVGADPGDADRPGAVGPPDLLRLLEPALAREPADHEGGRERGRDRRLRRVARARTTSSRSSSASAAGAPRARGRTSSTTPRGSSTRPSPRTARRGSAGASTSASSASPTSPRAPACASARR